MQSILGALFFVLGALIASFMGVVSARLYTGRSIARGRSRCDACARELPAVSLVPFVSFIVQQGRARCCGARLSILSPFSELALGTLFLEAYLQLDLGIPLVLAVSALALLLGIVLYDLAHQLLPPVLLYPFVLVSAAYAYVAAANFTAFMNVFATALILAGILAVLHYGSRGRLMGFADIPLTFGLSFMAGANAFSGFVYSFWIGAVIGILILLGRPKGSRMGVEVPFAPFLAAGFLLAYFTLWNPFALIAAFL